MDTPSTALLQVALGVTLLLGALVALLLVRRRAAGAVATDSSVDELLDAEGAEDAEGADVLEVTGGATDVAGADAGGLRDQDEADLDRLEHLVRVGRGRSVRGSGDDGGEPVEMIMLDDLQTSEVRVLRAQIRTLVAALEQADPAAGPVERARPAGPSRHSGASRDEIAAYRRRVEATLRAMSRQVLDEDSSERSFARVLAAIDRLDQPTTFARPVLAPARPAGTPALSTGAPYAPRALLAVAPPAPSTVADAAPVAAAPAPVLQAVPADTLPGTVATEAVTEAVATEVAVTEAAEAVAAPAPAGPPEPEVVLPVPAPVVAPPRGRRGLRRSRARVA